MQARTPRWDGNNHTLWLNRTVVTTFDRLAPLEEAVLAQFEKHAWTHRVPSPFVGPGSKRRLHDAVKLLNRRQKRIRFRSIGSGHEMTWEIRRK
jgi:hypothetical protein